MGLRYGYTTGSCATAATKACCYMLKYGRKIRKVEILLPVGKSAVFELHDIYLDLNMKKAVCSVIKDAGDDPDVTNGLKMFSEVQIIGGEKIEITGGEGVGIVTKPGLGVAVGDYAINPVPRKMIYDAVKEFFDSGVKVKIIVPEGRIVTKKTFNKKLGIIGGISILGTTGIVKPFSLSSLKSSIELEMKVARAMGYETIILVPGNIGRSAVKNAYNIPDDKIIMVSNFVGDMLIEAAKLFENIVIIGHPGKLIKILDGYFNTHSKYSKPAVNKVKSDLMSLKLDVKLQEKLKEITTVDGIINILPENIKSEVFNCYAVEIEKTIKKYIDKKFAHEIKNIPFKKAGIALINMKKNFIAKGKIFLDMEDEIEQS